MKQSVLVLLLLVVATAMCAAPIWQNSVKIRESLSVDYSGQYALGPDGSMVYVWTDLSFGSRDIYAQKYSSDGVALWDSPLQITQEAGTQDMPVISRLYDNRYIVAYLDYSSNPSGDLRSKVFTENGVLYPPTSGRLIDDGEHCKQNIQITQLSDNSVLFSWSDNQWGDNEISCFRLNQSGAPLWNEPRRLSYSPFSEERYKILAMENAKFMMVYQASGAGNKCFYMRYSAAALPLDLAPVDPYPNHAISYFHDALLSPNQDILLLSSYFTDVMNLTLKVIAQEPGPVTEYYLASQAYGFNIGDLRLQRAADDDLLTAWIETTGGPHVVKTQKIDLSTGPLWQEGGLLVATSLYETRNVRLAPDTSGGAYISWEENTYTNQANDHPRIDLVQLSGSGAISPLNTDTCISNRPQRLASMFTVGDRLVLAWQGMVGENLCLQQQIYGANNALLPDPEDRLIIGGLAGDIYYSSMNLHKHDAGTTILWEDLRDPFLKSIYYQVVDPSGNPLLPANGALLRSLENTNSNLCSAVDLQGRVGVLWIDSYDSAIEVRMQLIDTDGDLLWGEDGIVVTNCSSYVGDIHLSHDNGAFYVGWTRYVSNAANVVYAQKIVGGELQWGNSGIVLADGLGTGYQYSLMDICGRYFTLEEMEATSAKYLLKVQLLNPDGTSAWDNPRLPVYDVEGTGVYQVGPQSYLDGEDLVISWVGMHLDYIFHIYSQKISSEGAYLWDEESVMIGENYYMEYCYQIPSSFGPLHLTAGLPATSAYLNSEITGAPLWLREPLIESSVSLSSSPAVAFDNGTALMSYVNMDSLLEQAGLYAYLNLAGEGPEVLLPMPITDPGTNVRWIMMNGGGERAYALWDEYHIRKETDDDTATDFLALRLQAFGSGSVASDDPLLPSPNLRLNQNYPNPFNPETTISFSLDTAVPVRLEIYNLRGQLVQRLVDESKAAGTHSVVWDGTDLSGEPVSSGLYYYKLTGGKYSSTRKMILMK